MDYSVNFLEKEMTLTLNDIDVLIRNECYMDAEEEIIRLFSLFKLLFQKNTPNIQLRDPIATEFTYKVDLWVNIYASKRLFHMATTILSFKYLYLNFLNLDNTMESINKIFIDIIERAVLYSRQEEFELCYPYSLFALKMLREFQFEVKNLKAKPEWYYIQMLYGVFVRCMQYFYIEGVVDKDGFNRKIFEYYNKLINIVNVWDEDHPERFTVLVTGLSYIKDMNKLE